MFRELQIVKVLRSAYGQLAGIEGVLIFSFLLLFLLSSAFSIFLAQVGYFGALAVWLWGMFRRGRLEVERTGLEPLLIAYAVAELIATILAYNKGQSLLYMQRRLILFPILFLFRSRVNSPEMLKSIFTALVVSGTAVALWSFRDIILHLPEYIRVERRLKEFQMYMTAGGIMMINALLIIPFVLHEKTPKAVRWLALLALIPIGVNLLFTFTRSSWLGFAIGAIVIGLRRHRRLVLIPLVLVALVILFGSPDMKDRLLSSVDLTHPDNATRLNMWKVGWRMFLDHPIFGIGDMGTEQLWDRYAEPGWTPEGHLHNNLVMWLVTIGLVGFSVLVVLFIRISMILARIEKKTRNHWFGGSLALGSLGVMAGFHVNGLFEWNFGDQEIMMLLWATVGMTLAAEKLFASEG